jgi:hypothetical protein
MNTDDFLRSIAGELQCAREYCAQHKAEFNATEYFPFQLSSDDGQHLLMITSGEAMFFFELLARHGLYGNGPCWEGIIEQILERDFPQLLDEAAFDSEADACLVYFPSVRDQKKVARHLHEICLDEPRFEQYLQSLDKDRIDA